MKFTNLLNSSQAVDVVTPTKKGQPRSPSKDIQGLGCQNCPLDQEPGIFKVINLDRVKGRKIFVWAQAPGYNENKGKIELVGRSGQWFWAEMLRVGISRFDCDVQNVVRCWPTIEEDGRLKDRPPSKEEIRHCAYYTEQALQKSKAVVYLVLGQVAARALLGSEYKKDNPIFWSAVLKAKVVCADHPAYFLRGGSTQSRLDEFRTRLRAVAEFAGHPGRYSFVEAQDYGSLDSAIELKEYLEKATASGQRVANDEEDGTAFGQHQVLCTGFCYKPGYARTVYFAHDKLKISELERSRRLEYFGKFLADPAVEKIFHYGSSDTVKYKAMLGLRTRGYTYDTNYAEYLRYPHRRKFGLAEIAKVRFPEFAGYKDIVQPYAKGKGGEEDTDYGRIPPEVLTPYNCADNDLCKRIERTTAKHISLSLLQVYIHCAYVLSAAESKGPFLDYPYWEKVKKIVPARLAALESRLKVLSKDPDFNPGSHMQVARVVYDELKLGRFFKDPTRTTAKETMEILAERHEFPGLTTEWRRLSKMEGTYLDGYRRSADAHGGRLRTIWWLTGGVTGRLRSGGSERSGEVGIVNMQNLHNDPLLKNLLVSDVNWRRLLKSPIAYRGLDAMYGSDYSQIEVRVLAHMSQDKLLVSQLRSGQDIHSMVGRELTGWSVEQIRHDESVRRLVKNMHFGIIFGLGEDGIYSYLRAKGVTGVSENRARELHQAYFRKYKGVKDFHEFQREFVLKHGYVETMFGFRREVGGSDRDTYWGNQAINCFDAATEVLTARGWLKYNEISYSDRVLGVNDKGESSWQTIQKIHYYPKYNGPVELWRSRNFSAVTTPKHRWLTRSSAGKIGRVYTTKTMPKWNTAIPRTSVYKGSANAGCSDDFIRLIGWMLTDGHLPKAQDHNKVSGVVLFQSASANPEKVLEIEGILRRLAPKYKRSTFKGTEDYLCWSIVGPLSRMLRRMFPQRVLTPEFISTLDARQAGILVDTMIKGDGSGDWHEVGVNNKASFCCKDKLKADTFQMLCQVAGIPTTAVWRDLTKYNDTTKYKRTSSKMKNIPKMTSIWGVTLLRRKYVQVESLRRYNKRRGAVWCITVPSSFFVARRNGQTFVTGNSPVQGSAHQLVLMAMAMLHKRPVTYGLLKDLSMEVHDALYFFVATKDLPDVHPLCKSLMEEEVPRQVKKLFGIDLSVPLKAEAKAGFRLGSMVDYDGQSPNKFVAAWLARNKKVESGVEKKVQKWQLKLSS